MKLLACKNTGWQCDGSDEPGGCLSGITSFGLTHGAAVYTCTQCDFDYCTACAARAVDRAAGADADADAEDGAEAATGHLDATSRMKKAPATYTCRLVGTELVHRQSDSANEKRICLHFVAEGDLSRGELPPASAFELRSEKGGQRVNIAASVVTSSEEGFVQGGRVEVSLNELQPALYTFSFGPRSSWTSARVWRQPAKTTAWGDQQPGMLHEDGRRAPLYVRLPATALKARGGSSVPRILGTRAHRIVTFADEAVGLATLWELVRLSAVVAVLT